MIYQKGLPILSLFFGSFIAIFLTSCQPAELAATEPVTLTIAGSTAMRPVLVDLSQEFNRQHPHIFFDIVGGDSTIGEERVRTGQVELAASTLISPTIANQFRQTEPERPLLRVPIGLDGVVIIAHMSNPISNVTLLQLRELYSGRIWNWQEIGGNDETVLLVVREDGSGTRTLFDARVMGERPIALTAVVMPTSIDVVDYIADHPAAIGYISRSYVIDQINEFAVAGALETSTEAEVHPTKTLATPLIRVVAIEEHLPTTDALRAQSYFLIQPLYLVHHGPPRNWAKQFVDFALSPAGQTIVARYHLPIR